MIHLKMLGWQPRGCIRKLDRTTCRQHVMGRGGYRIIGLAALCAAGIGCAVQKPQEVEPKVEQAVAIPADLQKAVRDAELWGRALYERYTSPMVEDGPP